MKKEKNKFTYVWLFCLLLILGLCGIGVFSTQKGTMALDVSTDIAYTYNGVGLLSNTVDGKSYYYLNDTAVTLYGDWKLNAYGVYNNAIIGFNSSWNNNRGRVETLETQYSRKAGVISGRANFTSCGVEYNAFVFHVDNNNSTKYNAIGFCKDCINWGTGKNITRIFEHKSNPYLTYVGSDCQRELSFNGTIVSSAFFEWFKTVASPVYKCYYKPDRTEKGYKWSNNSTDASSKLPSGDTLNLGQYSSLDNCENGYKVFYSANGEKVNTDNHRGEIVMKKFSDISFTTFDASKYEFKGWYTKASCMGTKYIPGQVVKAAGGNYSFYACLEEIKEREYIIKYDANGGINAPDIHFKKHNVDTKLRISIPSYGTCNRFESWNTMVDGSGQTYRPGANYTINADLSLYAQWEKLSYKVDYDANGGINAPKSQTKYCGDDLILTTSIPEREGYTFIGWSTSRNGEVKYKPGYTYREDSYIKLYAKWVKGDNLSRCDIRDNPTTSDKMLLSIGLIFLTFVGFGYFYFIIKRVKD